VIGGICIQLIETLLDKISMGILLITDKEVHFGNPKGLDFLKAYADKIQSSNPITDLLNSFEINNIQRITLDFNNELVIRIIVLEKNTHHSSYGIVIYDNEHLSSIISKSILEDNKSILDSTQDSIFIDDMYGNAEWINKACESLYQIKKEEIIGKNVDVLEKEGVFSPSVAKMVFKKKQQITILHSNKLGKQILTTGTPIFNSNGSIKKIVSTSRDITELIHLKNQLEDIQNELEELKQQKNIGSLIVNSKKMKDLLQLAERLSQIDSTILLTGESGVGKGELAKYIHQSGDREAQPFVKVNCGAIPESLLESELFGYDYGAFTGSRKQGKLGMFELAQNGTIFLDEIGELPLNLQVKILQVIQDKEIQRVGGITPIKVDVRIITASNKDLRIMVNEKQFREDLFYRLNVVPIHIPPLRERQEDIFPLAHHFLRKYNEKFHDNKRIDPNTMAVLIKYNWPGNVRELENIIERLVITTKDDTILPQNLPNYILNKEEDTSDIKIPSMMHLKDAIEEVEKQIIKTAVDKYKTTREVAKFLGVSQPTIVRKINRYGINDTSLHHPDT